MGVAMSEEILRAILDELKMVRAELADMKTRAADGWQRTPEGLPICPKHGVVMQKREKQGDTWYSHKIETPEGDCYCRGYATKNGDGWHVEAVSEQGVAVSANGQGKRPIGFQPAARVLNIGDRVKVKGNSGTASGKIDSEVVNGVVRVKVGNRSFNVKVDRIV